jgi:hypothetical protein
MTTLEQDFYSTSTTNTYMDTNCCHTSMNNHRMTPSTHNKLKAQAQSPLNAIDKSSAVGIVEMYLDVQDEFTFSVVFGVLRF